MFACLTSFNCYSPRTACCKTFWCFSFSKLFSFSSASFNNFKSLEYPLLALNALVRFTACNSDFFCFKTLSEELMSLCSNSSTFVEIPWISAVLWLPTCFKELSRWLICFLRTTHSYSFKRSSYSVARRAYMKILSDLSVGWSNSLYN